jgi:hypothetical protein
MNSANLLAKVMRMLRLRVPGFQLRFRGRGFGDIVGCVDRRLRDSPEEGEDARVR